MASTELIVLIVGDSGLRSALIARLSLDGESLVTLEVDPEDPALERIAPSQSILVIDGSRLDGRLQVLAESGRWGGIIALADAAAETRMDRVSVLDRKSALVEIRETLRRWRAADQGH
uniref:hypothetical protein n=1 Tax=Sphingomonas bacterium TaxID=1895847 RepID=UPI002610BE0C|nr:hypothetical protein [Sphingomonas bacterium]